MNPVTALEIYDAVSKIYETYMTRSLILVGIGGFILGMLTCMMIFTCSFFKSEKKEGKS